MIINCLKQNKTKSFEANKPKSQINRIIKNTNYKRRQKMKKRKTIDERNRK